MLADRDRHSRPAGKNGSNRFSICDEKTARQTGSGSIGQPCIRPIHLRIGPMLGRKQRRAHCVSAGFLYEKACVSSLADDGRSFCPVTGQVEGKAARRQFNGSRHRDASGKWTIRNHPCQVPFTHIPGSARCAEWCGISRHTTRHMPGTHFALTTTSLRRMIMLP